MKKQIVLITSLVLIGTFQIQAQTVLRYETHGYLPNLNNELHIIDDVDPGKKGRKIIWDFSEIPIKSDFSGLFDDPVNTDKGYLFNESNVMLEEFGNLFFFKSDQHGTEQHGYISRGGHHIVYSTPFVKMNYPFSYGDSFSGSFKSTLYNEDGSTVPINGNYSITADAEGDLMLPGNIHYKNVLRVHEIKQSVHHKDGKTIEGNLEAFRWYVNNHRFPVLSIIRNEWIQANGSVRTSSVAAYNPVFIYHSNILSSDQSERPFLFNVYPNPASEYASIRFFTEKPSKVFLDLIDQQGRQVVVFEDTNAFEGEWLSSFSIPSKSLHPGTYTLRLQVDNETHFQRIIIIGK